jgi:hypothetical protein
VQDERRLENRLIESTHRPPWQTNQFKMGSNMTRAIRSILALGVAGAVGLYVTALNAQPVVISDLVEAKAIVESVDLTSRMVLIRDDQGNFDTIIASPEVRNLPQVHPGDYVMVSVHRSVALQMSKAGSIPVNSAEGIAVQTRPGTKPGAFRGESLQARVKITAIDLAHKTVSFVGPARILRIVQINDPRLLAFVRTLHEGDDVDVTYSLGIAARVVPARG